jgi:L-threonylcarbamoyladenylate synthase
LKKGRDIKEAADTIKKGGLVAFPTETVYGLGADAFNPAAVAKIFEVKKRPSFDPLIVHISRHNDLELLCNGITDTVLRLTRAFWPGPLTLVLPRKPAVPGIVTSGLPTVAVRMPAHPLALELIRESGTLIAAPSANRFGCLSPTEPEHVEKQLNAIDYLVDGGKCIVGVESTVIMVKDMKINILRPGGVTLNDLLEHNPHFSIKQFNQGDVTLQSPGLLKSHYSPAKPLFLVKNLNNIPVNSGFIAFKKPTQLLNVAKIEILSPTGNLTEAAINLFSALHRMEESDVDGIYIEPVPETGIGMAIMDRLRKAAHKYSNMKEDAEENP